MYNLPTFEECSLNAVDNKWSPLERFIYENEPADVDNERTFRDGLNNICAPMYALAMNRLHENRFDKDAIACLNVLGVKYEPAV